MTEYCRKSSLFVIWILFKIIWGIEKRSKFRQPYCRNSNKKGWERREKWYDNGVRKELNFGNEVTEIPFARFLLPRSMSLKCPKEKCSGKNQLWQSSCRNSRGVRREKKRIVATKLLKMNEKKKKWYFTLQHSHFGGPLHHICKKADKVNNIHYSNNFFDNHNNNIIYIYIYIYSNIAALVQYYSSKGKFKC